MKGSLRRRAIAGVVWTAGGEFSSQAIHYIVLLILAWLLSPRDFGLVGLAMIFMNFTLVVGELGLVQAIIQRPDADERTLCTAFWANLTVSMGMAVLTYANAGLITGFLGDNSATSLLRALSILFPITALAVVPNALLRKNLDFDLLVRRQIAGEIAFGIVALILVQMAAGVWSLVGAIIAQRSVQTAMLWVAVPWRPKLQFYPPSLRELLGFGSYAMVSAVLNKGFSVVDYFIVGKWLGTEALGFYTLAFQLAVIPLQRLAGALFQVAFPAFSIMQRDLARLRTGFIENTRHLFAALVPAGLFLAGLGPYFIDAVYGRKWFPVSLPLQVLAFGGFFYAFQISESIYLAVGRPALRAWVIALRIGLFVALAALFGLSLGVVGVAIIWSLSVGLTSLLSLVIVGRIVAASLQELLHPLLPALRGAFYGLALILGFNLFVPAQIVSSWIGAGGLAIAILLLYWMTLRRTYGPLLRRVLKSTQQVIHK